MKVAIVVLMLVAVAMAELDVNREFASFMRKHNKLYGSEEFLKRKEIFQKNLEYVHAQNKDWMGVTPFMDLTPEEFAKFYLLPNPVDPATVKEGLNVADNLPIVGLPTSFDWRDQGAVSGIKDQGQCGSCWAFSTTGNIESREFLAGKGMTLLSEQNLVDCDNLDDGCNGGLPSNAYKYVMANGLDTEECYPYKAYDQSCKFQSSCATSKISSWTSVSTDEDQIASYLYSNCALSVALNANWMQYYSGGVADPSDCSPSEIDHAVLMVGWGVSGSQNYWEIKNSWGTSWGENGYCRLVKGKGACGINRVVTSSIA